MSKVKIDGSSFYVYGELPDIGSRAPNFYLTRTDMTVVDLSSYKDKPVLINVYPSIDTQLCFSSVQKFEADCKNTDLNILCVSMDLPFALKRVNEGESFEKVELLSDFRNRDFGEVYGLTIAEGPLAGLLARAVILLDKDHQVVHTELVSNIANPPNYEEILKKI